VAEPTTFDEWVAAAVDGGRLDCSVGTARRIWDAAVAAERERCLRIAEGWSDTKAGQSIAEAIRADPGAA
jgi:hypothetical protein